MGQFKFGAVCNARALCCRIYVYDYNHNIIELYHEYIIIFLYYRYTKFINITNSTFNEQNIQHKPILTHTAYSL